MTNKEEGDMQEEHEEDRLLDTFSQAIQLDPPQRRELIERLETEAGVEEAHELQRLIELDEAEGPLARDPQPPSGPREARTGPEPQEKYELLEEIGRGAFGEVYRARHRVLEREVALKVHHKVPRDHRERFLSEARALAKVNHPNVVTIHDVHPVGEDLRLELELVEGENLHQLVERRGPMAAPEAALAAVELCKALAAIHAKGLVHMDVKPGNVMRASGGRIVLLDFGLTRRCEGGDAQNPVGGTPPFMAPECYLPAAEIGPTADVYSLGVTLYWLVTGKYPYPLRKAPQLHWQILEQEPRPLLDVRADLPREFVEIVTRALARKPSERFASMGAMEEALRRFLAGVAAATARRTRRIALAASIPGLALVALAAWFTQRIPDRPAFELEHTFHLKRAGQERMLEAGADVRPGDIISLTVHASQPTFLYVFDEDDAGNRYALFPLSSGAQNPLSAGEHELPAPDNGWEVDEPGAGAEHIYLLASAEPVPFAERLRETLQQPVHGGVQARMALQDVEGPWRGLEELDLRGVGALEKPASGESSLLLSPYFQWLEQRPELRSGLVFRRLDLRNP